MKVKLIVSAVAAALLTVLLAAPAHAYPPGPRGADCARMADNMAFYADQAHEARMRHDNQMWNVWQTQYETEWWRYQERGC